MATNIDIINAALTRTGNEPIASLEDGTAEAKIALANYDLLIEAELSGYRWKWASKTQQLTRLTGDPVLPWTDAYQLPSDVAALRTVEVGGKAIPYELQFDKILCNYDSDSVVIAKYTWAVPEPYWPGFFKELIIQRLEAIFLRGKERYEEGQARDKDADDQQMKARLQDAQSQPPVNPHRSKILEARGGGRPLEPKVSATPTQTGNAFDGGFG